VGDVGEFAVWELSAREGDKNCFFAGGVHSLDELYVVNREAVVNRNRRDGKKLPLL
jgi:hypothetical protein